MENAPKENLIGKSFDEIKAVIAALKQPGYRAKELWQWIYARGARDFDSMSSFSKELREVLAQKYSLARPEVAENQKSVDGTQKWLLKLEDGQLIEMVHIPDVINGRGALCISSQVGCTLTCRFCHTGTQRWSRNLTAGEIVGQILRARDELKEWEARSQDKLINNIVFMGMGEPLFNYDEVTKAIAIMTDPDAISIGKRRITVSTSGVVPQIKPLGEFMDVNLAVSLHAVTDELRDKIVPLNRKYPIKELLEACKNYPGVSNSRRITFEYVMLKDVNDRDEDARKLIKLLREVPSKVNLIPFNPWPGAPFECSTPEQIERFGLMLNEAGYVSPIRKTRGQDIMAACGQLKSASLRLSAAERAAIEQTQHQKDVAQGLA